MEIGSKIKEIRQTKNISAKELANKIGITPVFLCYIESGNKKPSLDTLEKICKALDISMADLFINETVKPYDLYQLVKEAEQLSPFQRKQLTEFIKSMRMKK